MTKKGCELVILGAGGHAKVAIEIAQAMGYRSIYIFDDNANAHPPLGFTIQGSSAQALAFSGNAEFFVAIGNNEIRTALLKALTEHNKTIATLIHPSAVVSPSAKVARGSMVVALAAINADVQIGRGCIINTAATIDHDCVLEESVHIAPGVNMCGAVRVGKQTLVGVGSAILPQVKVGEYCVIGAGATVCSDVPNGKTVIGSPAKIMKRE